MSHENVDIVIDVVALLHELTDEDVGDEAESDNEEDPAEGASSRKNAALKLLIDSLVSFQRIMFPSGSLSCCVDGASNHGSPSFQPLTDE